MRKIEGRCRSSYYEVARLIKTRKSVFIVGAGISTASGIPDFRSPSGLFSHIKKKYNLTGEDLFTESVVRASEKHRRIYMEFVGKMKALLEEAGPTETHSLLAHLEKRYRTRIYTQNIDGLEEKAGMGKRGRVVYLHGTMAMLACERCRHRAEYTLERNREIAEGRDVQCPACIKREEERAQMGKRLRGVGRLSPDIVLYGGYNSEETEIARKVKSDMDLSVLVAMGTSLRVYGVKQMVREMSRGVRTSGGLSIYVGRELPQKSMEKCFDLYFSGECDMFSKRLREVMSGAEILRDLRRVSLEDRREHPSQIDVIVDDVKRLSIESCKRVDVRE
jgi:NAD+-dependent protein deacetylase SIR2